MLKLLHLEESNILVKAILSEITKDYFFKKFRRIDYEKSGSKIIINYSNFYTPGTLSCTDIGWHVQVGAAVHTASTRYYSLSTVVGA